MKIPLKDIFKALTFLLAVVFVVFLVMILSLQQKQIKTIYVQQILLNNDNVKLRRAFEGLKVATPTPTIKVLKGVK